VGEDIPGKVWEFCSDREKADACGVPGKGIKKTSNGEEVTKWWV